MVQGVRAPLFVTVHDHFGIGLGAELMTFRLEFRAQFRIIVNLAVEDDPDRFLEIRHRLMSPGQVDDGKPAEPEPERAIEEKAVIVRPTMRDGRGHADDRVAIDRLVRAVIKLSCYATHSAEGAEDCRLKLADRRGDAARGAEGQEDWRLKIGARGR